MKDYLDIAYQSIAKLVPIVGPVIASLPIFIEDNLRTSIAYTNGSGIFIRRDIIESEPENVHIYLMHEILHHVIGNHEHMHCFSNRVANYAEDYWINYTMKRLWGYDVRILGHSLLWSKQYGKMLPHYSAVEIDKEFNPNGVSLACGFIGVAHPAILEAAQTLRIKYNIGVEDRQKRLVSCDPVDEDKYKTNFNILRLLVRLNNVPVDLDNLLEGVWMAAFKETVLPHKVNKVLTRQETLAFCWYNKEIRQTSINDVERAGIAAVHYINAVNDIDFLISEKIANAYNSISGKRKKITKLANVRRPPKRKINKLVKQIAALEARIVRLKAIPKFIEALRDNDVENRRRRFFTTVSLKRPEKKTVETTIVPVYSNIVTKLIRFASSVATIRYKKSLDFKSALQESLGSLLDHSNEVEPAEPEIPKTKPEAPVIPTNEKEKPKKEEPHEEADEEEEDDDGEKEENEEQVEPIVGGGGSGDGADKEEGKRQPTMLELLTEIHPAQMASIERIMAHMAEFESKLQIKKQNTINEFHPSLNLIPSYGNDVDRMDPSEVALLNNESTRLLFYSKYADSSLLSLYPRETKRQPIQIAVDASGSMQGYNYEVACGFGLAMMKKIAGDQRGGSFTIFSDKVSYSCTLKEGKTFKLNHLLKALLMPHFGGTSFDRAMLELYNIKHTEKWQHSTMMMVTDGGDHLSPQIQAYVKLHKTREDRLSLMLTTGSDAGFYGLNDVAMKVTKNTITNVLTKMGNSTL